MEELAYTAALALALVMGAAGVAKLRRRRLTERTFRSQGLAYPRALATVVPITEVVLSAGLVAVPGWAGVATLAVLAGFSTFLVRSMRRGDPHGCGCFGTTRPGPTGPNEAARNAVLLAAAALVAIGAETPVLPRPAAVGTVAVAAGMSAAALAWLRRRTGGAGYAGAGGLPPGSVAPALPGTGAGGGATTTLVAFVAPSCEGCAELVVSLERVARAGTVVRVVELADDTSSLFLAYGVRSTPFLVIVDADGRVRSSGAARSDAEVDRLLDRPRRGSPPAAPEPPPAAPAHGRAPGRSRRA